jgi:DhnA family fructose-bisphosphate aldolase class Ia
MRRVNRHAQSSTYDAYIDHSGLGIAVGREIFQRDADDLIKVLLQIQGGYRWVSYGLHA